MKTKRHLLILDNAVYRDIYHPADHWERFVETDIDVTVVRKDEEIPQINVFSHIIITGSEASIMKPDPWVAPQLDLVREAAALGIPLMGSCHGSQMIALALAGEESVQASKTPEFGWFQMEILEDHTIFEKSRRPVWSFCSHFDEVVSLPDNFTVLAKSERCGIQIYCLNSKPVFGIQSHPEINPAEGEKLIANFIPLFPVMKDISIKRPAQDSGFIKTLMENFLSI